MGKCEVLPNPFSPKDSFVEPERDVVNVNRVRKSMLCLGVAAAVAAAVMKRGRLQLCLYLTTAGENLD